MSSTCITVGINESDNIVTIVLILGCLVAVTLIIILVYLIPRVRSGEVKLKFPDIDWRSEILNTTSKKQKQEREERIAQRRAQREQASEELTPEIHSDDVEVRVNERD